MTKILFASDLHLLHPRVPTINIVQRMLALFNRAITQNNLEYFVIAGDVFDGTCQYSEEDVFIAQRFISSVVSVCAKNHIKLRILEGTPTHDRHQSRQFVIYNDSLPEENRCDLRYFEAITVTREEDDSYWLYVPDPGRRDPDKVLEDIDQCLSQNGLGQGRVDIAVTHTMYQHQVPNGISITSHDPLQYLKRVKCMVNNGHIHTSSIYRSSSYKPVLLTNGSVDRLKHGEEEPKGGWLATVDFNTSDTAVQFLENKYATYHRTFDYRLLDTQEILDAIKEHIQTDQKQFIRLILSVDSYNDGILLHLRKAYPDVVWKKMVDSKSNRTEQIESLDLGMVFEALHPKNAKSIIESYLIEHGMTFDEGHASIIKQSIKELK